MHIPDGAQVKHCQWSAADASMTTIYGQMERSSMLARVLWPLVEIRLNAVLTELLPTIKRRK